MKDYQSLIKIFKKHLIKLNILFIPVFLTFLLLVVVIIDIYLQRKINENAILPQPLPASFSKYPLLRDKNRPQLTAKASVVIDKDSGVVLFAKNDNLRFSPASTTKIMTALTAIGYFKPQDVLTVKEPMDEGSILGLLQGDTLTFSNLLYAMLLPSANDAAFVIAQNYPGGVGAFVKKMNENANLFNLYNTHFIDPAGLEDNGDYTTAFDLARLAGVLLKNKTLAQIVATKYKIISDVSGKNVYSVSNLNKLLGIDGIDGIKTGFTDEAGEVLVTSKVENGHTLIVVVMKSEDRFGDTLKLLGLVSGKINYLSIRP